MFRECEQDMNEVEHGTPSKDHNIVDSVWRFHNGPSNEPGKHAAEGAG